MHNTNGKITIGLGFAGRGNEIPQLMHTFLELTKGIEIATTPRKLGLQTSYYNIVLNISIKTIYLKFNSSKSRWQPYTATKRQ